MPRVQRSPTASSSVNSSVLQAKSDSDIPAAVLNSPVGSVNTASRFKRPCPEFSPSNDLQDVKREILQMLSTWKKEQEERLTKFSHDQNTCLSKLVSEIAELKLQNLAIQKSNNEIEKSVTFITEQYDDMIKNIDVLQKETQKQKHNIINLEIKIQDIQQLSRSSCVEIRNVPACVENESASDLSTIISKVGASVDMTLNNTELRDAYRLPGKPGTVRPIIAEFINVQVKNKLITSVRDFNKIHPNEGRLNTKCIGLPGDRRPVYVAEYLPASSRKLFYEARDFAKQKGYKFCWTANGNIFLRKTEGAKQVLVRSEKTLRNLQLDISPTMASGNEETWKKIVNSITIQGNALDDKYNATSMEMFIDQRDRELVLTTNTRTRSEFEDLKLQSDIKLAIFYFKHNRFPEMVARCRKMNNDFPVEMLHKYKLV